MIELRHDPPEPASLATWRRRNPAASWGDPSFKAVRDEIRRQLNREQEGLCVYCERPIGEDDGHIEHIKPQSSNPSEVFVFTNMAHSCDSKDHCGHRKGSKALPVEPRVGCNRWFELMAIDGRIVPALGVNGAQSQDAERAVEEVLNLNHPSLAWNRKGFADSVRYLGDPQVCSEFIASSPYRWSLRRIVA